MWQPRTLLAPVHAELLEPLLNLTRERGGAAGVVAEHEHADAPRLAVALDLELEAGGASGALSQHAADRVELPRGPRAEEGKRDVEVLRRHDPSTPHLFNRAELRRRPGGESIEDVTGKPQAEEEA